MTIHNSLSELIGNTPLVKLNHVTDGIKATIAVKVEYFNPGGSSKDRIAERIIDAAERSGELKPGGVIVEPTSGNTGVGLALVAQQRGYRTIFTLPDKVSEAKRAVLRAYGAEVVVTPTDAGPDDPRSYYQVAERLAKAIPGGYRPNQYDNPNGPESHYRTTGPEIWEASDHQVTHFVAGIGTGGTISGTGRYLKEASDGAVQVIGADPEGSIYSNPNDVHQYSIEGVGEDFYPKAFDRELPDEIVQVNDAEAFEMTRRLAAEEGLLVGGSSGMAVTAALKYAREHDWTKTSWSWCCCRIPVAAIWKRSSTTIGCVPTDSPTLWNARPSQVLRSGICRPPISCFTIMSIIRSTQTIRYFQGVPIMTISTNTEALNATALATRAIHAGQEPDPTTGAVVTPIYMTSTFKQDGVGGLRNGYDYSRSINPTRNSFDEQLAAVEGANYALSFASGLAAIDVLLRATLKPGDNILLGNDVYGGTYRLLSKVFVRGASVLTWWTSPTRRPFPWRSARSSTGTFGWKPRRIRCSNITDIAATSAVAHAHGTKVVVDNTFASPGIAASVVGWRRRGRIFHHQIHRRPFRRGRRSGGAQRQGNPR